MATTRTPHPASPSFNCVSHGFLAGQCVLIAGATPSGLNGEKYVVAAAANSFTFAAPGIGDQTASGTITACMAPAGWTEPYTATTNITCFKQGGGNGFYLNLDESTAQWARVAGFEAMTAVGIANGAGSFPTTVQVSGGLYWFRSANTSNTVRPWIVIATDRHLYYYIDANSDNGGGSTDCSLACFLDLKSYKQGDCFATVLVGGTDNSSSKFNFQIMAIAGISGHYTARSHTQIGSSVNSGKYPIEASLTITLGTTAAIYYPCPVDNGLWMTQLRSFDGTVSSLRGVFPGVWVPCHAVPLPQGDVFQGSGDYAGKTFLVLKGMSGGWYNTAEWFMEISNTWSI
jgi:hypothetical protein